MLIVLVVPAYVSTVSTFIDICVTHIADIYAARIKAYPYVTSSKCSGVLASLLARDRLHEKVTAAEKNMPIVAFIYKASLQNCSSVLCCNQYLRRKEHCVFTQSRMISTIWRLCHTVIIILSQLLHKIS